MFMAFLKKRTMGHFIYKTIYTKFILCQLKKSVSSHYAVFELSALIQIYEL